jgi:hypothetical protein
MGALAGWRFLCLLLFQSTTRGLSLVVAVAVAVAVPGQAQTENSGQWEAAAGAGVVLTPQIRLAARALLLRSGALPPAEMVVLERIPQLAVAAGLVRVVNSRVGLAVAEETGGLLEQLEQLLKFHTERTTYLLALAGLAAELFPVTATLLG